MVLGPFLPSSTGRARIERGARSAMRHSPRLLLRPLKLAARSFRGCSRVGRLVRQVSGIFWCEDRGLVRGDLKFMKMRVPAVARQEFRVSTCL